MLGRITFGALVMCSLAAVEPAPASAAPTAIDIRSQSLSSALEELARQTGAELLFDRSLVAGRQAPHVHGRYDFQAALDRLLSGTGLTVRRAASGAWLIVPGVAAPVAQELAAPEILVIGHRTQNFDIRRRRDDIQPYDVSSGTSVVRSHSDNVDDYFRSRVTANTEYISPSRETTGATNSEIDLRGLGADATLVLVDGRRLPGIPSTPLGFAQPDLNAIPIHAIDRIETLTGTAGGIFGFGALGGVVNVILKRDYRGVELRLTGGISSRHDARHLSIEGRVGFTPDRGRTDVMLYLSHQWSQPLLVGQRDFTARNLRDTSRFGGNLVGTAFPTASSISVEGFGSNLMFKPAFGGRTLSSDHTFLPTGFSGNNTDLVAALTEHAGQTDIGLSPGSRDTLIHSNPEVSSAIVNVRHRFSDSIEAYFDGLLFRNHGDYVRRRPTSGGALLLGASAPTNPFNQFVLVQFPLPGTQSNRIDVDSERYTAGIIAKLPRHWRGTVEATLGATHYRLDESFLVTNFPLSGSTPNPFGNWADFQQAVTAFEANDKFSSRPTNHYQEQLLQLAGPLFRTAAGPATLTLSVERRREKARAFVDTETSDVSGTSTALNPSHSSTTRSAHAELNSKIFGETAPFFVLKGLTVQLAAHLDSEKVTFSTDPARPKESLFHTTFNGIAYTAGAKVRPLSWLMLRGSFATGRQPPPLTALITRNEDSTFTSAKDPKRGNTFVFLEGRFPLKANGNPNLSTVRASTTSVGLVISPLGDQNLRFSLDFSEIHKSGEVLFIFNPQTILDHESDFPGRVTRAPLTDQDRARGFTGGLITALDSTAVNGTKVRVDTLDGRLDWTVPFVHGSLHLYGGATWQMHNVSHGLFEEPVEQVNFLAGPLKWRANGGIDWSRGSLTVGANLQYFGRYRIFPSGPSAGADLFTTLQGSAWVPAQAYLDVYASKRIALDAGPSGRFLNVDFGINNVLDASPPRETSFLFGDPGYSRYGDPRRRRIELGLTVGF